MDDMTETENESITEKSEILITNGSVKSNGSTGTVYENVSPRLHVIESISPTESSRSPLVEEDQGNGHVLDIPEKPETSMSNASVNDTEL